MEQNCQYSLFVHGDNLKPTIFDAGIFLANVYDGFARVAGAPLPHMDHPHLLLAAGPVVAGAGMAVAQKTIEEFFQPPGSSPMSESFPKYMSKRALKALRQGTLAGTDSFLKGTWYAGAGQLTGMLIGYVTR